MGRTGWTAIVLSVTTLTAGAQVENQTAAGQSTTDRPEIYLPEVAPRLYGQDQDAYGQGYTSSNDGSRAEQASDIPTQDRAAAEPGSQVPLYGTPGYRGPGTGTNWEQSYYGQGRYGPDMYGQSMYGQGMYSQGAYGGGEPSLYGRQPSGHWGRRLSFGPAYGYGSQSGFSGYPLQEYGTSRSYAFTEGTELDPVWPRRWRGFVSEGYLYGGYDWSAHEPLAGDTEVWWID